MSALVATWYAGEVVVHVVAERGVDQRLLEQRHREAHRHAADELRAGGRRVDDPAGRRTRRAPAGRAPRRCRRRPAPRRTARRTRAWRTALAAASLVVGRVDVHLRPSPVAQAPRRPSTTAEPQERGAHRAAGEHRRPDSLSPIATRTRSSGTSSASAAIWVSAVRAPVPMSVAAIADVNVPSASARPCAVDGRPGGPGRSTRRRRCRPASARRGGRPGAGRGRPSRSARRPRAGRRRGCGSRTGCRVSGSISGSLRMRSSIGSRPQATASSSIADSSANMPGHSPGARIHDGVGTSSATSRWVVRRFGAAYIIRVATAVCSANSCTVEVCSTTSWAIAVSRPSRVGAEPDPLDRRRAVAGQREHLLAGERELHRPADVARAIAASDDVRPRRALRAEPAADVRRDRRARCSGSSPNDLGERPRDVPGALGGVVQRQAVAAPRRRRVACGSIGLLCSRRGRVGLVEPRPRRAASAASTSPSSRVGREVRVDLVRLCRGRGWSARSSTSCGAASYVDADELARRRGPSRASRRRRRRRSGRGRRRWSDWRTASSPSPARRGAGRSRAQSTASTPGRARAAPRRSPRTVPRGDRRAARARRRRRPPAGARRRSGPRR